jgi:RNA polymerase-binding transcription factor DksA
MAKMKKAEVKPFKELLLALRARLRGDVSAMADAAISGDGGSSSSGTSNHMADAGTDTFEQDNTILLMNNESATLTLIEGALERIENGVYGSCVECNGKIPKMRLKIMPSTPFCVKCASEREATKY